LRTYPACEEKDCDTAENGDAVFGLCDPFIGASDSRADFECAAGAAKLADLLRELPELAVQRAGSDQLFKRRESQRAMGISERVFGAI
jgi:hypothetical protein